MRHFSPAAKSLVVAALAAVAWPAAGCSGASSGPAPTNPQSIHPVSKSKSPFVFSLTPPSLTFLHATDAAQTITVVVADQRQIQTPVQDPTVASAVLNLASITQVASGGFQETITVTPLKPGITNLFLNTNQGTIATVPIDIYGPLQASPVTGNVITCKHPDSCTAASTLGGASLNFNEAFYPNSYSLSTDTCQTSNNAKTLAVGGTYALQLTTAAFTTLVNNAIATNTKTQTVNCNTTVSATETVSTSETFTVTFQSLQRGGGL